MEIVIRDKRIIIEYNNTTMKLDITNTLRQNIESMGVEEYVNGFMNMYKVSNEDIKRILIEFIQGELGAFYFVECLYVGDTLMNVILFEEYDKNLCEMCRGDYLEGDSTKTITYTIENKAAAKAMFLEMCRRIEL